MQVAVIGSGAAGAAAALEAVRAGAEVVVYRSSLGATACGGGLFDLAPLQPEQAVEDGLAAFVSERAHHAYARLSNSPVDFAAEEASRFLKELEVFEPLLPSLPGKITILSTGAVRCAATVQRSVVSVLPNQTIGVAGYGGFDFAGKLQTRTRVLQHRLPMCSFVPLAIEFFERKSDVTLARQELAGLFEKRSALERLAESIVRAIGSAELDVVVVPTEVGLHHSEIAALSELVGTRIREQGEVFGGVQGLRIHKAITSALERRGVALRDERVERVSADQNGVEIATSSGSQQVDAAVVATGTVFGGGLEQNSDQLRCPLLEVPVKAPVKAAPGSLAPHLAGGVLWDESCRVLVDGARPWSTRVFAAGSILYGVDPTDGSGYGACVATGAHAGRQAAALA